MMGTVLALTAPSARRRTESQASKRRAVATARTDSATGAPGDVRRGFCRPACVLTSSGDVLTRESHGSRLSGRFPGL